MNTKRVLMEAKDSFKTLFQNSFDGIAILDSDFTARYLTPSTKHIMGYEPEELSGKNLVDFIHPDDMDYAAGRCDYLIANPGEPVHSEVRFQHRNNYWCVLDVIANNLLFDPEINGIVVNYRNISDSVYTPDAVREQEEYFRVLIENSLDGIAILDNNLIIRYLSPSAERIIGYRPEELAGQNLLNFVHPDDAENIAVKRNIDSKNRAKPVNIEIRFLHKDKSWCIIEGISNNLLHDTRINGIIVNYRDVTDRKKTETVQGQILALQSVALQAQSDLDKALTALERVLSTSEADGYTRTIIDDQISTLKLPQNTAFLGITPEYLRSFLDTLRVPTIQNTANNSETAITDSQMKYFETHQHSEFNPLTNRELEVLQLIAAGSSNYEIAEALIVAISTVKKHINSIYSKLGVCKRTLAITKAQKLGLL